MTNNIEAYLRSFLGDKGFEALYKVVICILIIAVLHLLHKFTIRLVNKFFNKTRNYKIDNKRLVTLNSISLSCLKYLFYFLIATTLIGIWGGSSSIQSITVAIAGIGGVAIGFGGQSLVKDVITGIFILLENQIAVGDIIQVTTENIMGTVEDIGIRTTQIRNFNGDLHIIPNGQISIVTNMTRGFKRALVEISVGYEENIQHIINILDDEMIKVYDKIQGLHEVPNVQGITEFAESAIIIRIAAECDINEIYSIEREIRKYVKIRFDNEHISMPYPHRTVEIINNKEENTN